MLWNVIQILLWVSICHSTPCCCCEIEVHGDKENIPKVITVNNASGHIVMTISEFKML